MMPSGLGEAGACGGEHDPVERGEPGAAGLAAQHPKLMSENEDLQVLGAVVSVREDQQTRQQADGQPEQEEHRWMVRSACSRGESEFPRPTGRCSAGSGGGSPMPRPIWPSLGWSPIGRPAADHPPAGPGQAGTPQPQSRTKSLGLRMTIGTDPAWFQSRTASSIAAPVTVLVVWQST